MGLITNGIVLLLSLFAFNYIHAWLRGSALRIPIVQPTWWEYLTWKLRPLLDRGYRKYSKASKFFRYGNGFYVIPPSLLSEARKLPSSIMSSHVANEDLLFIARTLGPDYHDLVPFVRGNIVHSIPRLAVVFRDEISSQFERYFSSPDGIWCSLPLWQTNFDIMCCIASRLIFGNTLARDPTFVAKIGDFVRAVGVESLLLGKIPQMLRLVVIFFLPNRFPALKNWLRAPILETLEETDEGNIILRSRERRPEDPLLLQLVEYVFKKLHDPENPSALTKERIIDGVTARALGLTFAAVDTMTITFSQVVLDLACHPKAQYADVIKAEFDSALAAKSGDISAVCVGQLKHLDSFIKESQRLRPIGQGLGLRAVLPADGWTFSNGDHLPQGAIFHSPTTALHHDEEVYNHSSAFDGFRFVNDKHPESRPSYTFLSFGHGNFACPGRLLALAMLKCMVIELLTKYEYEEIALRPPDVNIQTSIVPNLAHHIRIRRVTP